MSHSGQKEIQKASLIGQILSMEAFLLTMGIASLLFGVFNDLPMNIFFGIVIIPGVFILHKVRKKDWAKHWQDMEEEHKVRLEIESLRKKAAEESQKANTDEK
jgi:flagellar biosynthesis component FlhA